MLRQVILKLGDTESFGNSRCRPMMTLSNFVSCTQTYKEFRLLKQ